MAIITPSNFVQHHNHEDPFVSQLEEIDCELKRFDLPNNKARAITPPTANPKLAPPQKESIPIITPTKQSQPFHIDPFLFTLVEIDKGISKLNSVSTPITGSINHDSPMLVNSEHVINEAAKQTARVHLVQEFEIHAIPRANTSGKQKMQISPKQGSWK